MPSDMASSPVNATSPFIEAASMWNNACQMDGTGVTASTGNEATLAACASNRPTTMVMVIKTKILNPMKTTCADSPRPRMVTYQVTATIAAPSRKCQYHGIPPACPRESNWSTPESEDTTMVKI